MITQELTISIESDQKTVFDYIADLSNDSQWRSEIMRTQRDGILQLGDVALEESFLSKKVPSHLRKLFCCSYVPDVFVAYQTAPGDPHYLRSTRSVRAIAPGITGFTYMLEFDPSIVKLAMGFQLPRFVVNIVTRTAMKSYLKKLKSTLEAQGSS